MNSPTVVRTFPETNSSIELLGNNVIEISVTFDRKMDEGYSWVQQGFWEFPKMTGKHRWSADKKSHTVEATVEKGRTYVLMINSSDYRNFSAHGVAAIPYVLCFTTK